MCGGCIAVFAHTLYLGFQQADAFAQFVLRIGSEVFGGQLARGIALGAGKVAFIHRLSVSQASALAVNDAAR